MGVWGRKAAPSEQIQDLKKANSALRAENERLKQQVKFLQITITILLAIGVGVCVGLAASVAGAAASVAVGSATGSFFAVIMTSIAILTFMRPR
jgi:hypothetical protein